MLWGLIFASYAQFSSALGQTLLETTFHSSPIIVPPLTVLERSPLYDPENTNLFLICPSGSAVTRPGAAIYKSNGELVWADARFGECDDLNLQTYDGRQYLTMWINSEDGVVLMMNSSYEVVMNVSAVNQGGTDFHEFNVVKPENKTALITATNSIPMDLTSIGGPAQGWYIDCIVQEIDIATGDVLFNWTASDHISLLESYNNLTLSRQGSTQQSPFDAVHINSIDKDSAGNYLISGRLTQTIYKVAPDGTIIWRLGGKMSDFTAIVKDTEFHFQHHVRWRSNETELSVFDNGAALVTAAYHIVDESVASGRYLQVDQEQMTVTLSKRFFPSPNRNYTVAEGNIERYGDSVLMGYGLLPWIEAYSFETEELLYSALIGQNDPALWSGNRVSNYRVFQTSTLEFTGHPTQPPNVSVTDGDIYVSWNGATHVTEYVLFTGNSVDEVSQEVVRVRKSGFETMISGNGTEGFISVAALAANGTTLGRSAVYNVSDGSVLHT
ncbi:ASST-domain-containing protein [Favolaschia claudopus]|uniref:ASST-domain-containing protein n=1 Tax=Favolaschia claudopus TaxID=2862362 RepID=A0AAW0CH91_9AGAR